MAPAGRTGPQLGTQPYNAQGQSHLRRHRGRGGLVGRAEDPVRARRAQGRGPQPGAGGAPSRRSCRGCVLRQDEHDDLGRVLGGDGAPWLCWHDARHEEPDGCLCQGCAEPAGQRRVHGGVCPQHACCGKGVGGAGGRQRQHVRGELQACHGGRGEQAQGGWRRACPSRGAHERSGLSRAPDSRDRPQPGRGGGAVSRHLRDAQIARQRRGQPPNSARLPHEPAWACWHPAELAPRRPVPAAGAAAGRDAVRGAQRARQEGRR
mmetsp:Transcript_8135/g.25051  ORF Transcript_8135/g.25051 Transcript_8135/m.25051 type:complete len:263 (+) Transcript_8135:387-1175(+)